MKSAVIISVLLGAAYATLIWFSGVLPAPWVAFNGIALTLACIAVVVVFKVARQAWRKLRRFDVHAAARTAGALTSEAQRRTGGVIKAFKDGRKS